MAPAPCADGNILRGKNSGQSFARESKRLKTFSTWPVSFLDGKELAKNGFYYTKIGDIVRCAFCNIQIGYWVQGDDAKEDHLRLSPNCPFLKDEPCGNVPLLNEEDVGEEEDAPTSHDVCGIYPMEKELLSLSERSNKNVIPINIDNFYQDFGDLGVSKFRKPVAPQFKTFDSRLKTFFNWKSHDIQTPEKLAEAGFYYIGYEDKVLCFHCGGGLKNWEKAEEPWVEHARWFSKCYFVILEKGNDFVRNVLKKKAVSENVATENTETSTGHSNLNEGQPLEVGQQAESQSEPVASTSAQTPSAMDITTQKLPSSDDKEIQLCRVCYNRERGIVFLPCGHFVCCPTCTSSMSKCAVCRLPFKATVRAYLS